MNFTQTSRRMCRNLFGGLLLLLLSGNSAMAIPFSAVDLEGTVGTAGGTNEAMIVIDWDADSFAWLYQWNGTATFSDAYIAIADSEGGAFSWTEGNFVETMSYTTGGQTYTTGAAYWLSFWNSADGYTWSTNSLGVEEQPLVNGTTGRILRWATAVEAEAALKAREVYLEDKLEAAREQRLAKGKRSHETSLERKLYEELQKLRGPGPK